MLVSVLELDGVGINTTARDNQLLRELTTKAQVSNRVSRIDRAQGIANDHRVSVFDQYLDCVCIFAWVGFLVLSDVQPAPARLVLRRACSAQIVLEASIIEDAPFLLRTRVGITVVVQNTKGLFTVVYQKHVFATEASVHVRAHASDLESNILTVGNKISGLVRSVNVSKWMGKDRI